MVDDTAGSPSSAALAGTHLVFRPRMFGRKLGIGMEGEGGLKREGRQFGGIDRTRDVSAEPSCLCVNLLSAR